MKRQAIYLAVVTVTTTLLAIACSDDTNANPGSDAADGLASDSASDAAGDVGDVGDVGDGASDVASEGSESDAPLVDSADDGAGQADVVSDTSGDGSGGDDAGGADVEVDQGIDVTTDVSGDTGEVACGARAGNTCTQNQYCDFPDNICGAADRPGVCRDRPGFCTREYSPVCGCDGSVHGNECEGYRAGADLNLIGGCTAPDEWAACGARFCLTAFSYCRKTIPGLPEAEITFECVDLPDACGGLPSCECLESEACGMECAEQSDGGLLVTCLGA